MTEQEWLASTDPKPMLEFLKGKASDRKLRLFVCACCRRVWDWLKEGHIDGTVAVGVGERLADGLVTPEELATARDDTEYFGPWDRALFAAACACLPNAAEGANHILTFVAQPDYEMDADLVARESAERWAEALELRDIIGNPFRPATVPAAWLTPEVKAFARAIYDERRFSDMPILARALEEAGCTDADILNHCRQPGEHVRGCWVIDLVLGKQ